MLLSTLLLSLLFSVSASSNLTSQLWIDFATEQDGIDKYSKCLAFHSCDIFGLEILDAFIRMQTIVHQSGLPPGNLKPEARGCSCEDSTCGRYGTCCRDVGQTHVETIPTKCVFQGTFERFYVNTECPASFADSTIRSLCDTPIDVAKTRPDLEYWFVSSNKTMYTYRNMYCALCNGESMDNLVFWDIQIKCDFDPSLVPRPFIPEGFGPTTPKTTNLAALYSSCHFTFYSKRFMDRCLNVGLITTCPQNYTADPFIKSECESADTGMIQNKYDGVWYKNIYCARCNGVISLSPLECVRVTTSLPTDDRIRILIHPFGGSCSKNSPRSGPRSGSSSPDGSCDELTSTLSSCAQDEIYNWSNQKCQSICPAPLQLVNGECLTAVPSSPMGGDNSTELECFNTSRENFIKIYQQQQNVSELSFHVDSIQMKVFHNMSASSKYCTACSWTQYNADDLTFDDSTFPSVTLPDGTVHSDGLYLIRNDSTVFVCQNITDSSVAKELLGEICIKIEEAAVSTAMISISIACLIIMIIVYSILPNLHNVPGFIVLSQVVPLLLAYVFFLLRAVSDSSPTGCYIISVLVHYMFLSSNIWSFLFAIEITITVTSVYAVNQKSKKKFIWYSIAGWTVPLIPVIAAIIVDHVDPLSEFAPDYGLPQCWFNSAYGLYVYFLIPIAITLLLNFISYIIIIIRFAVLAYQTRKAKNSHKEKLILSVKLFFAFGLLWTFGILGAIFRDNPAISCIFVFVNSLSGVLLMLVFICNGAVFRGLKKRVQSDSQTISTKMASKEKGKLLTPNHSGADAQQPSQSTNI